MAPETKTYFGRARVAVLAGGLVLLGWSAFLAGKVADEVPTKVDVSGHYLRMRVMGTGSPTVVLEAGLGAPLESWTKVQARIAEFTRVIAYNRAGNWGSEPGPTPRSAHQIAEELAEVLEKANLPPPYILVGESLGGPYVRVFASRYPDKVAGLVLADPTQEDFIDWLRTKVPEANQISDQDRAAENEMGSVELTFQQARDAKFAPELPVVLITAQGQRNDPFVGGETVISAEEVRSSWLRFHQEWLQRIPNGRHIVTHKSGHFISSQEPELIVEAVKTIINELGTKGRSDRRP